MKHSYTIQNLDLKCVANGEPISVILLFMWISSWVVEPRAI